MAPRDLDDRDALRQRFDRGLRALDASGLMTSLDGFHRQALEILLQDAGTDAVLIVPRAQSQKVRDAVEALKAKGRDRWI